MRWFYEPVPEVARQIIRRGFKILNLADMLILHELHS